MRRELVALVLPPLAAAAALMPGGTASHAPALSASTVALLARRQPVGSPPCFRDSPGGRCVVVCDEATRMTGGVAPDCPRGTAAAPLRPVSGRR